MRSSLASMRTRLRRRSAMPVSDAEAVAAALIKEFSFPSSNVQLLLNGEATRDAIARRFLSFARDGCGANDRLVVFFAGHGHTESSHRGEVGYLVPWEGDPADLATLIRWDTLTRDADLIEAKHVLFVMDACYGGLAVTRALKPGAMRFMKDMLQRRSRQVLTAGKANEVVADLGGPLPNHSVFTGHFLEALAGKAAGPEGILTANGVIAYVYRSVANDAGSRQTPHFGYLNGDGDLIFNDAVLAALAPPTSGDSGKGDADILSAIPGVLMPRETEEEMTAAEQAKELLAEEKLRIKLHDFIAIKTREALSATGDDNFPNRGKWSADDFVTRLQKYEVAMDDLAQVQGLLGLWSEPYHRGIIQVALQHLAGRLGPSSGLVAWSALRYYPLLLLMYCGGIGAIAANKYENLRDILLVPIRGPRESSDDDGPLLLTVGRQMSENQRCLQDDTGP
ncbi:MAG: caspase family protein [Bryobacteraceae bacterium]